jgi:uncharacterized protein YigA (DUF484 family)
MKKTAICAIIMLIGTSPIVANAANNDDLLRSVTHLKNKLDGGTSLSEILKSINDISTELDISSINGQKRKEVKTLVST